MTRKQIDQMKEMRLWIKEIIIPLAALGGLFLMQLKNNSSTEEPKT